MDCGCGQKLWSEYAVPRSGRKVRMGSMDFRDFRDLRDGAFRFTASFLSIGAILTAFVPSFIIALTVIVGSFVALAKFQCILRIAEAEKGAHNYFFTSQSPR